jgi:quinoprotein glucose dehydrogenase
VLSYNMPSVLHLLPIVAGETGTGASPFDRGQSIYQSNCQLCHGANLQGQPIGGIPSLIGVTDRLGHVEFEEVVMGGRGTMPAFPQLRDGGFEMLHMYLSNPDLALTTEQDNEVASTEMPAEPVRYQSGWFHVLDSQGVPVIEPPWFRLTAYDMNEGTIKWQIPVGEVDHLIEQGIEDTGSAIFLRGGPSVTAGGLVFLSTDDMLRAYDSENGEELWVRELPGAGEGIPAIYEIDGRQFVVVAATEGRRWGQQPAAETPRVPQYVAFALPESGATP